MKLLFLLFVALLGSAVAEEIDTVWTDEMVQDLLQLESADASLTAPEMIVKYGYDGETHYVTTEDGYILEMHRIRKSSKGSAANKKPVIFLMHGLLCSSVDWILMGPGKGLGYILADAGYDVWMGNGRGNTYSKNHETITDFSSKEFWYFDWHEIGIYDLPAMIDFTLETTGQKQVTYIGHSQGTTAFYVMASERTEYNDKIKAMFSLAPVAYMGNVKSPLIKLAATFVNSLTTLLSLFGVHEFLPNIEMTTKAGELFCNDDALTQFLCSNTLFLLCGFNKAQLNTTMLPTIIAHTPAGASTRQVVHYGQEIRSNKFRWWDLGWVKNLIQYKSLTPPNYDLSAITAPVYLMYSDNDWMAAVKDVTQLYSELGNPVEMYRVLDGKWNHLDYIYGINAKELVYDPLLTRLKNIS